MISTRRNPPRRGLRDRHARKGIARTRRRRRFSELHPSSATSAAVSAIEPAARSPPQAPASAPLGARLQDRRSTKTAPLASLNARARSARAGRPRVRGQGDVRTIGGLGGRAEDAIRAAISTSAAESAAATRAGLPPPGAGVASATEARNSSSGCLLNSPCVDTYPVATTVRQPGTFDDVPRSRSRASAATASSSSRRVSSRWRGRGPRERFAALFEAAITPPASRRDEVNWKRGRDRET